MKPAATKHAASAKWMRVWLDRGTFAVLLWPLSMLFRLVVFLRFQAYRTGLFRSTRLPVPVVVVGNVFIGGTGKTPLTIWLAQQLQAGGFRPGIVSRGYGSKADAPLEVSADSLPGQVGDEPLLMKAQVQCPVFVGRNRAAAAKALLGTYPDVNLIISDDGLQHYALQRDLEILLFDGRGAGNGWLLPAGPLREPYTRRRDFTVVNSQNYPAPGNLIYQEDIYLMHLVQGEAEQLIDRSRRKPLSELARMHGSRPLRMAALAGIGNPSRFFGMLKAALPPFLEFPLPDHYDFRENPFADLDVDCILITEKDAVKCARIPDIAADRRIWVVPVQARLESRLAEKIVEKCRGCASA